MFETSQIVLTAGEKGQDRIKVMRDGERLIFVIADGAGGRSGGAEAAEMVVRLVCEHARDLQSCGDCEKLLGEIDRAILADGIAGETTAVIVVASVNKVFGASVGDSGAWILSGAHIDELSQGQVRKPFIGTGAALPVGFSRGGLDGTLLVTTDGLLKYTSREAISATIGKCNLDALPEALVKLVRYASGNLPDDIAIGLCRPN